MPTQTQKRVRRLVPARRRVHSTEPPTSALNSRRRLWTPRLQAVDGALAVCH